MKMSLIYGLGTGILALDFIWLFFYYFYATVEIYNLIEQDHYQYLGHLWVKRKKGSYYLYIPEEICRFSYTTEYRIIPGILFYYFNQSEEMRVSFHGKYDVFPRISDSITVKNHIATYLGL